MEVIEKFQSNQQDDIAMIASVKLTFYMCAIKCYDVYVARQMM